MYPTGPVGGRPDTPWDPLSRVRSSPPILRRIQEGTRTVTYYTSGSLEMETSTGLDSDPRVTGKSSVSHLDRPTSRRTRTVSRPGPL